MKKTGIIALVFALTTVAFTLSNLWKVIDSEKVVINFKLDKEGTKGTFTGVEASIDFDQENLMNSKIKASVNVASLSTENTRRDEHLKAADFFDAATFPTITFSSNEISRTESGFIAKGDLVMKGHTESIQVPFTFEQDKSGNSLFKGTMKVSPHAFGVTKGEKSKDETVSVSVELPLKK